MLLLARALGAEDLGLFSLVLVVQSLVAVVANAGMFAVTQYHAASEEIPLERTVAAGVVGTTVATVILVPPLSFVLASAHPLLLPGLPLDLLVLGLLAGPLRIGFETLIGVFIGRGDPRAQAWLSLLNAAAFTIPVAALFSVGALDLDIAVRVWVAAQVVSLVGALLAFRRISRLAPPGTVGLDARLWREVLRLGLGAYLVYFLFWASLRIDRVALNVTAGADALGAFAIAGWVSESFNLVPAAVANVLYPRLAALEGGRDATDVGRAVRTTIGVLALAALPVASLVGIGSVVIAGPSFSSTFPLLLVLLPGQVLFTSVLVLVNLSIARRVPLVGALYYGAVAVARIGLILALARPAGLLGAMSAVGAAMVVIGLMAGAHLARWLGCDLETVLVARPADLARAVRAVVGALRLRPAGGRA